jgi:hypothetical protein
VAILDNEEAMIHDLPSRNVPRCIAIGDGNSRRVADPAIFSGK